MTDPENPANGTPMSLALRQLHQILQGPVFWVVNAVAILLTAMAGPYFTLERMNFAERVLYWGITVVLSSLIMTFLSIYAYRLTEARQWNWVVVSVGAGLAGLVPVVGTVLLAEMAVSGPGEAIRDTAGLLRLAMYVAPTLIAVTLVVHLIIHVQEPARAEGHAPVSNPVPASPQTLLHSKLPHHLGHDIVCVQAQDHYVEVTTTAGSAMVLMRLRDVVKDLDGLGGMQVHRSWWVNLAHVTRMEKGTSGPELLLSSGQRVLVGRSFRAEVRAAIDV